MHGRHPACSIKMKREPTTTHLLREFERQRPGRHSRRLARQLLDRTRPRAVTLRTSYGIFYVSPTPDGFEYRSFELPGYRVEATRAGHLVVRIQARRLF